MINSTNASAYIHIYPFMRRLGIRGNTLILYALLYSFTNGRIGIYYGSRKRLADYLSVSERTVYRAIRELRDRGLIENAATDSGIMGIRCSAVGENRRDDTAAKKEVLAAEDTRARVGENEGKAEGEGARNTRIMTRKYCRDGKAEPTFLSFGRRGYVMMTEPQYRELTRLLTPCELMPYFEKVENMVESSLKSYGATGFPHSHYRTVRRWITEDTAL